MTTGTPSNPGGSSEVSLFATLAAPPSPDGRELASLPAQVNHLEVRADLAGEISSEWIAARFRGQLLFSLRSRQSGGTFEESDHVRRERQCRAALRYDLVELEPQDLHSDVLARIAPQKRLVAWYGPTATSSELRSELEKLSKVEARMYRIIPASRQAGDELIPLEMLLSVRRTDVVAHAEGPTGSWSRLLAPYLGAPAVFGIVQEDGSGQGSFSIGQLVHDYGLPTLRPVRRLFGIVGGRVQHSLSPGLHNAAYRSLGLSALYLPFSVPCFDDFWSRVAEGDCLKNCNMALDGFSLAAPHKEAALSAAADRSPAAGRAGAANVMARRERGWMADTADVDGVLGPLRARGIEVGLRRVAVIGCGGAGRAAAVALDAAGASVTLVNRTVERGAAAAERLGLPFLPLSEFKIEDYSIVVNATPVGRGGEELPFAVGKLSRQTVVVDFAYGPRSSQLVTAAQERGGIGVEGREVLYYQARRQFQVMTGREMPAGLVRQMLDIAD